MTGMEGKEKHDQTKHRRGFRDATGNKVGEQKEEI